jgi:RNA polymerase sigma factor (sigma-70 family)
MATLPLGGVLRRLRNLVAPGHPADQTDSQLLRRFAAGRDEGAFEALLLRHGPLVLGICRRLLRDAHIAEDAFQATFLILAKKAGTIRRQESLAAWLYRVAVNVSRTAARADACRRAHEREAAALRRTQEGDEARLPEWQPVLDEEVSRLPRKYRVPVVLCYFEGRTHDEAARQLGWPVGTVKGRLARARDLLRARLCRRGLALSAASLTAALEMAPAAGAVPDALSSATLGAALAFSAGTVAPAGAVSARAVMFAKEVLPTLSATRLLLACVLLLFAAGAGALYALGGGAEVPARSEGRADRGAPAAPAQGAAPAANGPEARKADEDAGPWGKPVDGLAARLVLRSRYAVGQPITAVVEVKNTSNKTRYLVPRLDPHLIDGLALEVVGPDGGQVRQTQFSRGSWVSEGNFQPLAAGAVQRFEVIDLRDYFPALNAMQYHPARKANDVRVGKYRLQFRFRSPKVPERFNVGQRVVNGKAETIYKAPAAELVAGQWAGEVASAPVSFDLQPLGKDDLVVHEWGVFTVFNDAKYANVNRKAEWASLPSFFYRQFPKLRLRWVPAAWDKPVVYFYARPESLRLSVQVTFAEGAPVVWWPAVADPVDDGGFRTTREPKRPNPFRSLTWDAWVGDRAPDLRKFKFGPWVKAVEFPLPANCWLREARVPGASKLTVVGNIEGQPKPVFPGAKDRPETELFLYYDGLVPAPSYLRCEKVEEKALVLRNRARFDLARLFVVDRRARGVVRFAAVGGEKPLKAGTAQRIEPAPVAAADWPAVGVKRVRRALLDAGLFAGEADALLKIWRERLFEADGVTVFHILPAAEYDRMLPLSVLPAPAVRPVRVGIALHPHVEVEPDLTAHVGALIRRLGDPKFATRTAASKALLEVGPLAIALLRAELKKEPPLETRRRIEEILSRVDAAEWLALPGSGKKATR